MTDAIFLDAEQIAAIIRIGTREIKRYVESYGMPAFQETPGGKWKARKEKLEEWAVEFEKLFINKKRYPKV